MGSCPIYVYDIWYWRNFTISGQASPRSGFYDIKGKIPYFLTYFVPKTSAHAFRNGLSVSGQYIICCMTYFCIPPSFLEQLSPPLTDARLICVSRPFVGPKWRTRLLS